MIQELLHAIRIGPDFTFEALTVFPLYGPSLDDPGYRTLDEAVAAGVLRVTEVQRGASVPRVRVRNTGDLPVLLLDGEEIEGAMQNRVVNISILAPAKRSIAVPVSCVEAGRWEANSSEFRPAPRTDFALNRSRRAREVTDSVVLAGVRHANQSAVWQEIDAKAARLDVFSATGAMADLYGAFESVLDDYVAAFSAEPGQVGTLFALGGTIVGVDLFDSARTHEKLLPKLIRSYALDAIELKDAAGRPPSTVEARNFLDEIGCAPAHAAPAVGLGEDVRFVSDTIAGGALVYEGRVVHLGAFRQRWTLRPHTVRCGHAALQRARIRRNLRARRPEEPDDATGS